MKMSTLITTDSFACRIELSTVKKWTTPLPCTESSYQLSLSSASGHTLAKLVVLQLDGNSNESPVETHGVCLGNTEGPLTAEAFNFLERNINVE